MTQHSQHHRVVIIGAGPTGLTTAGLLALYGVTPLVIDRAPGPLDLPRAIVLDDEGTRTLQVLGLDQTYVAQTRPATGSAYYDDEGTCFARTGTGIELYGFPKRNFIHQPDFEAALRDRLEALAPGALRWGHEMQQIEAGADGVTLQVQTPEGPLTLTADWVLACDGGRSPTRESLGIAMEGRTYAQDWIVIDTRDDPDQESYSKFYCRSDRPQLTVPAPHGGRRYEFMVMPGESNTAVLDPGFIARLLHPYRGPTPESAILRKTVYTFHARMAERFRQGRVLLLGDAAHLTPPFAGQGMNAGLRDAHNLAWKLAAVVQGGAGSGILDSYADERRDPAWSMIQLAVAMGDIVMPADPSALEFRRLLLRALEPHPGVRDYLIQMRFKPRPRYAQGLFLDLGAPEFAGDLTGEMIPQPWLRIAAGRARLDGWLGPGFSLIAQDAAGAAAMAAWPGDQFAGLPLGRVHLGAGALPPEPGEAARMLFSHRDRVLLVRPDRYCAASLRPDALAEGLARYQAQLTSTAA